jgi:hypothetical protein
MTFFLNTGFRGLFCKTLFLTTATCALTFPIHAFGQSAPAPAASSCDPAYYDTLQSRAWLEAQREITQNQNLIFKPDSVLQYTCFDKHLGAVKKAIEGADASAYYPSSIAVANNDSGDVNVGSFVGDVLQSLVGVQPAYAQNLFLTPDSSANTSTFGGIGAQPSVTTTTNTATTIQNTASQVVSSATNLQNINASTITSQLTSQLTSSALQQVQSLVPSMTPALQQQLNSALNSAVGSALTSSVQNSITGALSNAASGTINNAVTNAVQNSITNTLQSTNLTQNVNKAIT